MRFILVIYLVMASGPSIQRVDSYATEDLCNKAGQRWVDTINEDRPSRSGNGVNAYYACIPAGEKQ